MSDTFEAFVASERARLRKERTSLQTKRAEIDEKLSALDKEMAAITAYENVKAGRTVATRAPRATGTGGRRTGQREAVLTLVKQHTDGISAADVLKGMNADSDSDKTSVRNALSALKRLGSIGLKNGKYLPA
jgi:hypothetical protein